MTVMKGGDPSIPAVTVRGIDLRWIREFSLQLSDAPPWYSLRARMDGELCGSCDLGLPEFGCSCPPNVLLFMAPGAPVLTPPDLFKVDPC